MVDILSTALHRALIGPNYIALTSTVECDYRLRADHDRHIMHDAEHKSEKVEMVRWIASYILPTSDDTPWIEG